MNFYHSYQKMDIFMEIINMNHPKTAYQWYVLLFAKVKDKGKDGIIGGYTKAGWDIDEASETGAYGYKWCSDKNAFIYCYKYIDDNVDPFICNVSRSEDHYKHAISKGSYTCGTFGYICALWFEGQKIRVGINNGSKYMFPSSKLNLVGNEKAHVLFGDVELEAFYIDM